MRLFFFQAEDGIRDLVRSRGLGDVYKRQEDVGREDGDRRRDAGCLSRPVAVESDRREGGLLPVSYTHLTLPTSDLV